MLLLISSFSLQGNLIISCNNLFSIRIKDCIVLRMGITGIAYRKMRSCLFLRSKSAVLPLYRTFSPYSMLWCLYRSQTLPLEAYHGASIHFHEYICGFPLRSRNSYRYNSQSFRQKKSISKSKKLSSFKYTCETCSFPLVPFKTGEVKTSPTGMLTSATQFSKNRLLIRILQFIKFYGQICFILTSSFDMHPLTGI